MERTIDEDENLHITCNGCQAQEPVDSYSELKYHNWNRSDAYGLSTGVYCDACYAPNSGKYPYRRDRYYDPGFCGERMDDDY